MAGENWTFWFNLTNFALGIITLLAVAVVFVAVGWDLTALWLRKVRESDRVDLGAADAGDIKAGLEAWWHAEPHSLSVPELGLTMADGGEKIEPPASEPSDRKPRK
jgi:hypothetical protein